MKSVNMLFTGFIYFSCFVKLYYFFNIDTNYPIVYEDPSKHLNSNESSFFGYSVVLYPGNTREKPWIVIGAPRGYNVNEKAKSGICFKCGIAEVCNFFDVHGLSKHSSPDDEKIDTAWIGASMDISYTFDRIVTCAPRWIKIKKGRDFNVNDYYMQGACYWFHSNDSNVQELLPLLEPNRDIYTDPGGGGSVYNFAQGQSGFSVHLPVKSKELLLGAPGVYNWDGTSILFQDSYEPNPIASRLQNKHRRTRFAVSNEFGYKNIGNAIETKQTLAYDLLGYSVTSGYFFNRSKLLYVVSSPRSNYQGQVLVYDFDKRTEKALLVKDFKLGKQFGEYFGASVTAGDINGDMLDDLVVGAPFHTEKKYNEGKIYIFLGSTSGHLQVPKRDSVVGENINGQFGTTLQYLGDIDHDGFGDVAVAAPYEEERTGVVYIFRGLRDGLDSNYCQRIVGNDVYQGIRGFGMSISRGADIDINGYKDIAVGAFLSGHVVLLRSRPVITIFQELKYFVPHLDFKTKKFEISECFWYTLDQTDPPQIRINRTILLDQQLGRAYLELDNYVKVIDLHPNRRFCKNLTLSLTNSFSNRYNPITVSLSHQFVTKNSARQIIFINSTKHGIDKFCVRCPVYNKYGSISTSIVEIPFALGCKSGNICKASLELNPKIPNIENNEFVLGSADYITLQINITNLGEKAYLTQVLVTLPEIVSFRSTPSACTEKNSSSVLCAVDNPLDNNIRKIVILDLDMTTVNRGKYDQSLLFTTEIMTSSENDGDTITELVLKLKREADVTITGKSEEHSYSFRNITQGKPNFTQIYQVEKFGSSPLNEIHVEINIPHIFKNHVNKEINFIRVYPPVGTLVDQEVICSSNFTYLTEEKYTSADFMYSEVIEDEKLGIKKPSKRFLESTEEYNASLTPKMIKYNEVDVSQNRTFYVNCSMDQVICSKILCSVGPLRSNQIVKIKLKMLLNIAAIEDVIGKKDVVLFATEGRVVVTNPIDFIQSGDKPDRAETVSFFIKGSEAEEVALWIIIVSAVVGLILLLLVIFCLIKVGFFKRTAKEELKQLKKEMENDVCENINKEGPED